MSVNLPVGKGLNKMRRQNGLAITESLARVVSEDASDDNRALPLGENLNRESEEDLWRCGIVREVYVRDDAQKTRQDALFRTRGAPLA